MKIKMNASSRGLVIALAIFIVFSTIVGVISMFRPGEDYTKDYTTYNKVEKITSTFELMEYCHTNDINYSINDGCFDMEGYDITFSLNKSECSIDNNKHANYFYLLDNGRYDFVKTSTDANGDNVKTYEIKVLGTNYEMSNGSYTLYNMWPAIISFSCAVIYGVALCLYLGFCQKCKRCKQFNNC